MELRNVFIQPQFNSIKRAKSLAGVALVLALGFGFSQKGFSDETPEFSFKRELLLVPQGVFTSTAFSMNQPVAIEYGLIEDLGKPWLTREKVNVEYIKQSNGVPTNTDVKIKLNYSGKKQAKYLAFRLIHLIRNSEGFQQNEQVLALEFPMGSWVSLPVFSGASYPFECYQTFVDSAVYGRETFLGKAVGIVYGYTPSSQDDFIKYGNVPWFDVAGYARKQDPDLLFRTYHDGGYKGSMISLPVYVWVPFHLNLVYRVVLEQASYDQFGGCRRTGGLHESGTHLVEVR